MKVRIGIDVGGTFTDAVVINDSTYELVGSVKLPTTHDAKEGVALGIVQVLKHVMQEYSIKADDVTFIAHGTTQATNALLEGDVAKVGILTIGQGIEGSKSKNDTKMGLIELAQGKRLETYNEYLDVKNKNEFDKNAREAINKLIASGADAIVATEAFSVDNPENENAVVKICLDMGIPATAGNDVSKLYGLKVRTRTAVINGSILPKMLDAANMTEKSILDADIKSPLMVMRCDGGVMTVDEVRNRPIMTILSGPAAGVAGALMYEKLTDGIFFEVGGTSTDISCVKDGNVMIKYAEVGGHKTYLNSLDVRTVGIGGGSMIQVKNGIPVDVGPRSAHIAGFGYELYAETADMVDPVLKWMKPTPTDPDYAYVECSNGMKFALTQSGAANVAGFVPEGDYARGNIEAATIAWETLAKNMGVSVKEAAMKVLDLSAIKNGAVVKAMIKDYSLDVDSLVFVGGGGGASTVVPHLATKFKVKDKLAKNSSVISPIGVALAMVRDMVERSVSNPTEEDILSIRSEAIKLAVQSGANPDSVEVRIEVDTQLQKLRAIAIGTTELRTKELGSSVKSEDEIIKIVADNLKTEPSNVKITANNGHIFATETTSIKKHLIFFKKKVNSIRLIDRDGVIRLQKKNGSVVSTTMKDWKKRMEILLDEYTVYADGGAEIPNIYIANGGKIVDLSSMPEHSQIFALADIELQGLAPDDKLIIVCTYTTENERG